uniref:NB-ARC domain containing protein n=1 Tax=Solanum tuberosum TaxID=4113 RepID=M1B0G2_SOLTU
MLLRVDDFEVGKISLSPRSRKGPTNRSEKRQDTSNTSRDLLCSNSFDALLKTTGNQVRLTENDHDLIQEKQVSPPALNSKLSPETLVFVPKCVLARKNESSALVSNTIDLGEDSLDEEGVDLGEDSYDEDEEDNMLDICFDRVAREGDISPRQQISGSNKSKKKTYGRQHSWDEQISTDQLDDEVVAGNASQGHHNPRHMGHNPKALQFDVQEEEADIGFDGVGVMVPPTLAAGAIF